MILTLKAIALALIWIGGITSACVAVVGILSLIASAAPVVAAGVVIGALVVVAFLGIAAASSSKL